MSATTANEFTATADAVKTKKPMSGWGCTWRVGGSMILFAAAVFAIVFGAQYAIAAVAALELSAMVTSIITYAIAGVAYVGSLALGWMTGGYCTRTMAAREAAKCAAAA